MPPSKTQHQRALVLDRLCDVPVRVDTADCAPEVGDDVARLRAALDTLGRWADGALGASRDRRTVHLGEGATGFRFVTALAALRPEGSRTLVRGTPALLRRPHAPLVHALTRLGARIKRRRSGALRVLGGRLAGGAVRLDAGASSQFGSALLLAAPRFGGLTIRFTGRGPSLPYLRQTLGALAAFGVPCQAEGLEGEAGTVTVAAAAPRADLVRIEPDASCAAAWWTAAALTGGDVVVEGVRADSAQADVALLPILERMGARVEEDASGAARVRGRAERGAGDVNLEDAPDLLFLLGVLAAAAAGRTTIRGVAHTRRKESDRVGVLAAGLRALGARVRVDADDALHVDGGPLRGEAVSVGGDHRAAFAFGVLGLAVPGIALRGARAATKSHPGFLGDLAACAAADALPGSSPPGG